MTEPHLSNHHRGIKSFVLRSGRLTSGQKKALELYGQQYILTYTPDKPYNPLVFGEDRQDLPTVLEIGSGMGQATAAMAKMLPEWNFIACEVHLPGVGSLIRQLVDHSLINVRIVVLDALEFLKMIADEQLLAIHIFFPDPWPKKRHHKRRLIQANSLDEMVRVLKPSGYLHCATDWADYAEHILLNLQEHSQLKNQSMGADGFCPKPGYRVETKFERRGKTLGHTVYDIIFSKIRLGHIPDELP
ncbi:MAG: tRNA (guanosine(46)-N7)-methyltransferase TrmB [Gammaproteobacteria bacterium]|nr:tRNA (guanosine(46)-N7)-methyltransferase TrmB [Gammaproteobacteria bacterium]